MTGQNENKFNETRGSFQFQFKKDANHDENLAPSRLAAKLSGGN